MSKQLSLLSCLTSVPDYLTPHAAIRETDSLGKTGNPVLMDSLIENTFYRFDSESACSICHAIEDLALEEANGHLLAGFQHFTHLAAHRERYAQLGATIDEVQVVAAGPKPRQLRRVSFIQDSGQTCADYRLVLYTGKRVQALFIGRQANQAQEVEEKEFLGFYSFSPRLVKRLQADFLDLARGKITRLREFVRQAAIDQAAKQIQRELASQREFLEAALCRLQLDGERYCADKFASDLEKGLAQLQHWKTRMPEILAHAEGH